MTEIKVAVSHPATAVENLGSLAVSKSEDSFRLVLEASPDGFIILRNVRDATGEIIDFCIEYANPVAARGVNRTAAELLGQHLLQLFPTFRTNGVFERYVTVAQTGRSETFETFYDSQGKRI